MRLILNDLASEYNTTAEHILRILEESKDPTFTYWVKDGYQILDIMAHSFNEIVVPKLKLKI